MSIDINFHLSSHFANNVKTFFRRFKNSTQTKTNMGVFMPGLKFDFEKHLIVNFRRSGSTTAKKSIGTGMLYRQETTDTKSNRDNLFLEHNHLTTSLFFGRNSFVSTNFDEYGQNKDTSNRFRITNPRVRPRHK